MSNRRWPRRAWPARAAALTLALCLALAGCDTPTNTPGPAPATASPAPVVLPVVTSTTIGLPSEAPTEPQDTPDTLSTDEAPATLDAAATQPDEGGGTPAISLATGTPSPTPGGPCTNNARFVADVTVPDGTEFLPGQTVDKQWRVRNVGTCDWGADYRLVLVSGNSMGAASEVALYPAKAGSEAILDLSMTAPADPGSYTGRWQARSPTAKLFGDRIFVTINVTSITATATITVTP